MAKEQNVALKKLQSYQRGDGGFPWFKGARYSNRYITQHIISGMGKLDHLGVRDVRENPEVWNMLKRAIDYADNEILEDYKDILKYGRKLTDKNVNRTHIHYFYTRSFFSDIPVKGTDKVAFTYFKKQARKYWADDDHYTRALNALYNHREGEKDVVIDIMKSIREHTIENEELGTYIKYTRGWSWHQAPIEQQALMIEAFDEIEKDQDMVDALKTRLLKQKQTQDWKTTKATVEAIYALLLRGTDWIADTKQVELNIGGKDIDIARDWDLKAEAGTGYVKNSWKGEDITAGLGDVTVMNPNASVTWGALYWQYFEDLDKIEHAETPLKLEKKLFKEIMTETGEKIIPITEEKLTPGDKVIVRIELRVDRQMDYVHMKDMRSSGFEPVNVLSQYKYQDGLGYYESTRDASTDFFFDRLTPGTYVFEYPLKVYHKGNFSNGITTIQCMYAPEFTSHSGGVRVIVE